ncbi:MAG: thioesterase family protein [Bacteroidetes bacterium]|nr:thioesterase family protein [Bacteroidota bacterium]
MEFQIKTATKGSQQMIVQQKDTAAAYGSGLVEVFATPAMLAFMEMTALKSIEDQLPDDYTTVGSEVHLKHLRASPVGQNLICNSTMIEVSGRKIVFELQVWDEDVLVGLGTHTRYVVDKQKFMNKY